MTITRRHAAWLAIVFFAVLVAVVFQQILTSMTDQGIASGSPYDNAAAYPKAVAILIGILAAVEAVTEIFRRPADSETARYTLSDLRRPALLLVVLVGYLFSLGFLGYHLSTPGMIMAIMLLCGMRRPLEIVLAGAIISLVLAFFFEFYLTIVLPGGVFGLHMPW